MLIFALLAGLVVVGSALRMHALRDIPAPSAVPEASDVLVPAGAPAFAGPETAVLTVPPTAPPTAPPARERRPKPPTQRRPRDLEARLSFFVPLVLFLAVGVKLALVSDVIHGDALARVGNAYYVVFSRDPHLAAVGFVWNPLPSLLLVPFLPLKFLWADLTRLGFIGNIESAIFMAGTVALIRLCLKDLGVRRGPRLAIVVLFALHPMIVIHGGYGTTEGMFIFFLVLSCHYLIRWLNDASLSGLVGAGIGLGLAYWTRYEAVGAGLVTLPVVLAVAYFRSNGTRRERRQVALTETAILAMPFAFCVVSWAAVSWLIVGEPFATLTSQYGAASQAKASLVSHTHAYGGDTMLVRISVGIRQIVHLEPMLVVLLALALVTAWFARDLRVFGVVIPLAGVNAFILYGMASNKLLPTLRYSITAVPTAALLTGYVISRSGPALAALSRRRTSVVRAAAPSAAVGVIVAIAMLVPAFPSTVSLIRSPLSTEESAPLWALTGLAYPSNSSTPPGAMSVYRTIASYLDGLHLRRGAVLTDSAFSFPVVLASNDPTQFVVTSDLDFERSAADPVLFHIQYLLVPSPSSAPWDALNVEYPSLFESGAGIGKRLKTWRGLKEDWRLYRVEPSATS